MKIYIDGWKDEVALSDRATPREIPCKYPELECDDCHRNTDEYPDMPIYRWCGCDYCRDCLERWEWRNCEPAEGTCEGCGCSEEVRRYEDGRVGCKHCIGDWAAWDCEEVDKWED